MFRERNKAIWENTKMLFTSGQYKDVRKNSLLYDVEDNDTYTPRSDSEIIMSNYCYPKFDKTIVEVTPLDTFTQCAIISQKMTTMCLNMASPITPCLGDPIHNTQEEDLFRRSNLCVCIDYSIYPLRSMEAIFSPEIYIVKNANYELITPIKTSVITIAAVDSPKIKGNTYSNARDYMMMESKIDAMFRIAYQHNIEGLILGAFGCGAFSNPTETVIKLFNDAISKYNKCFKYIGFAVRNDGRKLSNYGTNKSDNNYEMFKKYIKKIEK